MYRIVDVLEDTPMKTSNTVPTAAQVAKILLQFAEEDGVPLTNLHLQKLLYYVQGKALGREKRKAFSDEIEAWKLGPVVPTIYHMVKNQQDASIAPEVFHDGDEIDPMQIKFIACVWEELRHLSAWGLAAQTHEESPWISAWEHRLTDRHGTAEITEASLTKFFKPIPHKMSFRGRQITTTPQEWLDEDDFYEA